MSKPVKIEVDIVLNASQAPNRDLSPSRFAGTLESIIRNAIQSRLPSCDVEIRSIQANWPGARESFPGFDIDK